ncbi:hypothetical protein DPMN_158509 [Dreissena polymorpha]|uniref:Uncharacterized protein n=1 Tax=Dreissena polymorpha TaxID=45954 RepID=A0A9D4EMF8_DREPO|nr:hypothetical protein DPMN_158509 [Dreissena polymorpha]
MSAANKLSGMMDELDVGCFHFRMPMFRFELQDIILAGYREAVANQQKDIVPKLSAYYFNFYNDIRDLHSIWTNNKSDVLYMYIHFPDIQISQTEGESASHIEFDLASCNKLESLELNGKGILLSEFASTSTAEHLVGIVLKSEDLFQCADPPPLLPSIKCIKMRNVTCSYTCLRCLFCTLLTLDHALTFDLQSIYIKCAEAAKREISAFIHKDVNNSSIVKTENDNPYLFKALHGLNIKSLSLSIMQGGLNVDHEESLSQLLSSLTQLETLSIRVRFDSSGLWKALHGLNIKSLSLSGLLYVGHVGSLSQSLSSLTKLETLSLEVKYDITGLSLHGLNIKSLSLSLTQLETLSIRVGYDSPGLWKALHVLNIKSLSLSVECGVADEESLLQSLSSLTQLETLSIRVGYDSPGLWKALHGLNIKSLSLSVECGVADEESLLQSLSSLTQLETLSIDVGYDSPVLWKALHVLNIKSLSLSIMQGGLNVDHKESLSQSLSSLKQLETLSIRVRFDSSGLWKALHGLNIKSLSLSGLLYVGHVESLSQSLSSLTKLETLSLEVKYDITGLSLHGLNIKSLSLSLSIMPGSLNVDHEESLSQSLSSLTQLETLSIKVKYDSPVLWKALHGLNIKSLSLSGKWGGLDVDNDESLSQSLASLTQLETVTLYVKTYKQIELPQSLKYLNIYCDGLLPSKVLELVDTLLTCTQRIESNRKLCCSLEILIVDNIPLEEYTVIQQELQTRKNVTVERFQISDRKLETNFVTQCE